MLRYHQSQQGNVDAERSAGDGRMSSSKGKGEGDGASRGMFLDNYSKLLLLIVDDAIVCRDNCVKSRD